MCVQEHMNPKDSYMRGVSTIVERKLCQPLSNKSTWDNDIHNVFQVLVANIHA